MPGPWDSPPTEAEGGAPAAASADPWSTPPTAEEAPPTYTVNQTKEENQAQDLERSNALSAEAIKYIAESDKVAPEVRADTIRLSAAYGVPAHVVEPSIQKFREREAADRIDWPKVVERIPALARYLGSHADAVALFKEPGEVDALHGMAWGTVGEWSPDGPPGYDGPLASHNGGDRFNALDKPSQRAGHWVPPAWYATIAEATKSMKSGFIRLNDYAGRAAINLDPRAAAVLDVYDQQHPGAEAAREAKVEQDILEAKAGVIPHDYAKAVGTVDPAKAQPLHQAAQGLRGSAWMRLPTTKYAADFADWLGENWGAKRLLARAFLAPAKMAPMIAGTVAAGAAGTAMAGPAGGVAGSALFLGEQNLETAHEAVAAASPGGKITPGGRALAVGASALGGAAMAVGFGPIANKLVGDAGTVAIKQIFTSAARQGVKPTASAIVGGILSNAGKEAALGASSMGVQAGINEGAAQVAAGKLDVSKIGSSFLDATLSSLGDMALLSGLGAGRELLADHGKAHAQATEAAQYAAAIEAAKASKLLKRSPEIAKKVINDTGGKIHIAAEDWATYFQGQKIDPEKAAIKVLGDDGATYRNAAASGGDLTIPAGDFLAEFANTPHAEGLAPEVRLNSDSLSQKMVERRAKEVEEHVKSEMKRRAPEIEEGKKQVQDFIEKQARAVGYSAEEAKANAATIAEFSGTMAARLETSVQTAAAIAGLHELRLTGEKGARLAEAARSEFMQFVTPEASTILKDRLATLAPEARARELYIDPVTGLQNGRAFDETPVPEGQQVGRIAIARVKGINDHPNGGHNKANEYYRAVGAALHELAPGASYKVGGDFAVHVADEAQLKGIVDEVNRRIAEIHPELKAAGAVAGSFAKADAALDKVKSESKFPDRKAPFPGDAGALKFPEGRATAEPAAHLHQAAAALTDEKYFQKAYLDTGSKTQERTGILSREAWEALPRKANVAAIDLKGIRVANERFGKDAGNRLIEAFSRWAAQLGGGGFDLAHLSGDEYAAQHHDPAALDAFLTKVQDVLKGVTFEVTDSVTGKKTYVHPDFRHDIGPDYDQADRAANAKRAREGVEGVADPTQRAPGVARRPEVPDRLGGARPQDFPGGREAGHQAQEVAADRAWAFLVRGEHGDNPVLKKLVDEARSSALAEGKGKIDPKLAERATKAQGELDRLAARAGKRPTYVELPDGSLRATEIPSWLKPEEFRENRSAWEWTRSAIDAASTKKIDKVEPPEPLQRLIAHYMEEGLAGFPDLNEDAIKRGYAIARLLAGHGGKEMAPRREQLIAWAKEPAVTRAENPISEENWRRIVAFTAVDKIIQSNARGFQWDKKVDAVNRWLYSTKAELNPERADYSSRPPAIYGESLTAAQAAEREAAPAGGDAAKLEAKRAEVAALNEQAASSVVVKPQPKLDFEQTTALAGSKSKHFERYTAPGGIGPAKVAKALEFKDPAEMISAMVARREGATPVAHVDGATVVLDQRPLKGDEGDPRGEIRIIFGGGKMVKAEIPKLLAGDKSTELHEMGHFLSWGFHNIATSDLATPQIRADYDALLKWAGYESPEHRYTERGTEKSRAKEEKFSHAWEQYIAEGKAPAKPLVRVFNRMKGWMVRIYRGIKGVEGQYQDRYGAPLGMTDEVRGIFDRLLATDDALNDARQQVGANQPDPEAMAAMSPEARVAYGAALDRSKLTADEETMRRAKQILDDQVGPAREGIRAQVAAELDSQPIHRATRFLQSGELAGADGVLAGKDLPDILRGADGQPLKLDRKDFVVKYGKDAAAAAPRGIFAKGKGGEKTDAVALALGFDSGEELAKGLGSGEHRDQALARQTQERVDAMFGSARQFLGDVAMEGVHNEHELEARLIEHRALSAAVDPAAAKRARTLDPETLKRTVADLLDDTKVSDLDPARYERAERKAALLAAKLQGAGDGKGAAQAREQRILNFELYRQARDRAEALEKAKDRLDRGTDDVARAKLGKADPAYRDAHDQILAAVGIGDAAPAPEAFAQLVERAALDAQDLDFDQNGIRDLLASPRPWDSLTAAEAQNVADAVDNIRAAARARLEVDLAGKKQTKDAFFEEFQARVASVRKPLPKQPYSKTAGNTLGSKVKHVERAASAVLQTAESWAQQLDGGTEGPAHRMLVEGRLQAREKEVDLTKRVLAPLKEKFEAIGKEFRKFMGARVDEASDILPVKDDWKDRIAPVYTGDNLVMLFLNWGNEGNRQRVRDGNGWTDQQVEKALALIPKPIREAAQQILDTINSLYPDLAALHERETGLQLGKVEAAPIRIGDDVHEGGYFPLRYDSRFSKQGERQVATDAKAVTDIFAGNYVRPAVSAGHREARVDIVKAPVDLDWRVVPAHLAQAIRDISHREWVKQAAGLILDPRFKATTEQCLGPERAREIVPWLKDVANARVDSSAGATSDFQKIIGPAARSRIAVSIMGLNVASLAKHTFDPWTTMSDVDGVNGFRIANAYRQVASPWGEHPEFAISKELAYHDAHYTDNLREAFTSIGPGASTLSRAVSSMSFALHRVLDRFTTRVAFKAAYADGVAKGMDSETAAERADGILRRSFPSGDIAEKPQIMRTKQGLAAALMFYGYASKIHNLRVQTGDAALRSFGGEGSGGQVALTAAKWLSLGVFGALGSFFAGRGWHKDPEDDSKGENGLKWLGAEVGLSPLDEVPIAGPLLKKAITNHKANASSAPELMFLERAGASIQKAIHGHKSDDASISDKVWNDIELLTAALGGPVGQVGKTVDYLKQLTSGELPPQGPGDVAGGLLYGKPKKGQAANPFNVQAEDFTR